MLHTCRHSRNHDARVTRESQSGAKRYRKQPRGHPRCAKPASPRTHLPSTAHCILGRTARMFVPLRSCRFARAASPLLLGLMCMLVVLWVVHGAGLPRRPLHDQCARDSSTALHRHPMVPDAVKADNGKYPEGAHRQIDLPRCRHLCLRHAIPYAWRCFRSPVYHGAAPGTETGASDGSQLVGVGQGEDSVAVDSMCGDIANFARRNMEVHIMHPHKECIAWIPCVDT